MARQAQRLHMEVQLCREMGWTQEDLYAADEEFIWATATILSYESERMKREQNRRPPTRTPL